MSEFIVYRAFINQEEALRVASILKENNIEYQLADNRPSVDITLTGGASSELRIELKIKSDEFVAVDKILELDADKVLDDVDPDHYLFKFSNDELYEILLKKEEWSAFDFELAKKILTDRGEEITEEFLNSLRAIHLRDLAEPERVQKGWIVLGYITAVLGGWFGYGIGWYLWNFKKTLPNGDRVYVCSNEDRIHGRKIFILSNVGILFWVVYVWMF
ncbi:MAG: hypothetical protein CL840_21565 [Crocinitomicaceae bacterium]|nr:hypothetical protein [Crocinitomicaceae bacterium]|tara:strand:+ start:4002 stop:4652 length:651 start_codon:yes stop_codon:yes gene_type:complete